MSTPRYVPNEVSLADLSDYTAIANFIRSGSRDYQYLIENVNGYYHVYNKYGQMELSTTSLSTAFNSQAMAGLTAGRTWVEEIVLKGNFTIDSTLLISSWTKLTLNGSCTLANGANCDMVRNVNQATSDYNVYLEGGYWNGNKLNQTNGKGMNLVTTTYTVYPYYTYYISNLWIWDTYGTAIYLSGSVPTACWMNNVDAETDNDAAGDAYGCYMQACTDSLISHCHFGQNVSGKPALYLYGGGGMSSWNNIRTDGGVVFQGTVEMNFSNFTFDTQGDQDGLTLYDCEKINMNNGQIRAFGSSGNNTYSGIHLLDDNTKCKWNQLSNIIISRQVPEDGTNRWKFGIKEDNAFGNYPNNNLYCNINAADTINGNIISGSGCKISNSLP